MKNWLNHTFTESVSPIVVIFFLFFGSLWANTGACQEPTYLKASNAESSDFFGVSVASSGLTLVVGATGEDSKAIKVNGDETNNDKQNSGAAYVFVQDQFGEWSQQAYLKVFNSGGFGLANIGQAVAISGDTAVISSPWVTFETGGIKGAAYVFERTGEDWCQEVVINEVPRCSQFILKPSSGNIGNAFGISVAISGDTIVVGDSFDDDSTALSGAAYVFVRDGNGWSQQAYLKASNTGPGDQFGGSVAISGDTIVVGASLEDSDTRGVNGNESNDLAEQAGAAYVFVRDNNDQWNQQAYLKASNTDAGDAFGGSVAVSGNTIVVGAGWEDSDTSGVNGDDSNNDSANSGAAYVFVRDELGDWSQHSYMKASNAGGGDLFGLSVAISGDTFAVSAEFEDDLITDSGATYVFVRDETGEWRELDKLKASNPGLADRFGESLAIADEILVTGTWFEDSDATGVNGDGDNDLAEHSGAAYAFTISEISDADTTPPVFEAFAPIFVFATGACDVVLGIAVVTDNVTPKELIVVVNDWPGGCFPLGETTVTWTATDLAGNSNTATQLVTIIDFGDPACPDDAILCDSFEDEVGPPGS